MVSAGVLVAVGVMAGVAEAEQDARRTANRLRLALSVVAGVRRRRGILS
jgi:hypothetical protein